MNLIKVGRHILFPQPTPLASPSLRVLYVACLALGSIAAHLISEFVGMGSAADAVAFSPRHIYLGAAGLVALALVIREVALLRARAANGRDAKRIAEIGLASLPFGGKRYFWIVTAALQFAAGALTEIGEGCPLCGHDVAAGFAGALIGAIILALVARALSKRLPSIASALVQFAAIERADDACSYRARLAPDVESPEFLWFARLLNRPPPVFQSS